MNDFPNSTRKAIAVLAVICVTTFGLYLAGDRSGKNTEITDASGATEEKNISSESGIAVSRSKIDFGPVAIGQLALESVSLTNNSADQPLTVNGLFLDGNELSQYSFKHRVPVTLAPKQSIEIEITFLPEAVAIATGELIINAEGNVTLIDLIGAGTGSNEPIMAAANPVSAQAWKTLPDIKNPRFESSAVQYRDDIYAFNGFGVGIDVEATVEKFDAGTQKWSVIGNTSINQGTAVTHNGVIRNGNEVWMLGGRVGDHPGAVTSKVWKYNLNTQKWSAGPKLPVPVAAGGAALINNRIHWFGGLDKNAQCDVSHHYVYDLGNPSAGWKNISSQAPMPVPRNHFATIVYGGLIYAIGGQFTHGGCGAGTPDTNLVHAFNPNTNNWTQKASLPAVQSHIEPSTFVHEGAIYVVGGATDGNKVYRYDPSKDDWDTVAVLPKQLLAPIARVIDDELVVSSGGAPSIVPSETTYITDMEPLLLSGTDNENTDLNITVITEPESNQIPDEDAGLVVLEAEYHDSQYGTDSHQWVSVNQNGASNSVAMVATPDNNSTVQGSDGSPSIAYFAYFDRPGTWYLWLRGLGDTVNGEGSNDSVHAGLNGSLSETADQIDNFPPDWNWTSDTRDDVRATLNIPSTGIHAVNLWMREDGLAIDKLLLTTDSNYIPSGVGPTVDAANLPVNPEFVNDDASPVNTDTPVVDPQSIDETESAIVVSNDPVENAVNNSNKDVAAENLTVESGGSGGGTLDLLILLALVSGWLVKPIQFKGAPKTRLVSGSALTNN